MKRCIASIVMAIVLVISTNVSAMHLIVNEKPNVRGNTSYAITVSDLTECVDTAIAISHAEYGYTVPIDGDFHAWRWYMSNPVKYKCISDAKVHAQGYIYQVPIDKDGNVCIEFGYSWRLKAGCSPESRAVQSTESDYEQAFDPK